MSKLTFNQRINWNS